MLDELDAVSIPVIRSRLCSTTKSIPVLQSRFGNCKIDHDMAESLHGTEKMATRQFIRAPRGAQNVFGASENRDDNPETFLGRSRNAKRSSWRGLLES